MVLKATTHRFRECRTLRSKEYYQFHGHFIFRRGIYNVVFDMYIISKIFRNTIFSYLPEPSIENLDIEEQVNRKYSECVSSENTHKDMRNEMQI